MKAKETYAVVLLQATGETLIIKESPSFEDCKVLFDKLEADLEKARKTKGALFKLREKWVISCDPQFIVRISLIPKKAPQVASPDNPYQKRMERVGFSEAMSNKALGGDLTDEGYTTD